MELNFKVLFSSAAALGLLMLVGCGGGSSGTGGQFFDGRVLTQAAQPVAGVEVSIGNTGSAATTDAQGQFSLQTPTLSGDVEVHLSGQGLNTSAIVPGVTETAERITVTIQVDLNRNQAEVSTVNVEEHQRSSSSRSSRSSRGNNSSRSESGSNGSGVSSSERSEGHSSSSAHSEDSSEDSSHSDDGHSSSEHNGDHSSDSSSSSRSSRSNGSSSSEDH